MWYNRSRPKPVIAPNPRQRFVIRAMILVGIAAMVLFFTEITRKEYIGYPYFYYPLLFSLGYMGLRILYEWYHYWDMSIPETPELKQDFSVDIFTTFVPGEPYDMLIHTLEAIQAISYPHTTYLCDEGNDPYLKEQCERLGIVHVYRGTVKTNAKAGNINHAIYTHAKGDICLILDPDHVPAPDFLDWVLPHFQNPEVGFVQVVQAYDNIYENLIAKASAQQTFQFYGPIMMSMNSYGTAQAIGANCTFRRKALDSIGGHAPGLAEDMHTSMKLHAAGWKSVYVPRVLSRGLVPNTLSAYYKQQLKWSRGVFELLVTTYPRIFSKLSWRQRFHYGLLPWHYFMGFLFLINFMIPILSLFSSYIPMQVGLAYFLTFAAPLLVFIILIRHYVQKWVMEEDERGFHVQGGLISIGTWWIHALGFVYTLLRRKVPYNPTPKDGQEENTLRLNIPNLAMAGLSIAAIIYGLWRDFNPYNMIMAGFAGLNILFIGFVFFASMQNRWRAYKKEVPWLERLFVRIWYLKDWFWKVRHGSYQFVRSVAFPIVILLAGFLWYISLQRDITNMETTKEDPKLAQHFVADQNAESPYRVQYRSFPFLSPAIPIEGFLLRCNGNQKYPYIHWQIQNDSIDLLKFHKLLHSGALDPQLAIWSEAIKVFKHPIYLAPFPEIGELNDPSSQSLHRDLWEYINQYFNLSGINNLMLVYNCPSPELIEASFPGFKYLSFIEIDAGVMLKSKNPLDSLQSYLVRASFQNDVPWVLRFKETVSESNRNLLDSISTLYPNFSGILCTDAKEPIADDLNQPFRFFRQNQVPEPQMVERENKITPLKSAFYSQAKMACNYYKGLDWKHTKHPLFRRVIESDFKEMKSLGISHINRYGPSFYDANIFKEAEKEGLEISYCFYIGNIKSFSPDNEELQAVEKSILDLVRDNRDEKSIVAWHLGGAAFSQLSQFYQPPQLLYEEDHLIRWLDKLSKEIKALDSSRPLSAELNFSVNLIEEARSIFTGASDLDGIGVNIEEGQTSLAELQKRMAQCQSPLFIQSVGPDLGVPLAQMGFRVSFNAWQDDIFSRHVALQGLKNLDGYKKRGYAKLETAQIDSATNPLSRAEDFKVIPLARAAFSGQYQSYLCLLKENGRWRALDEEEVQVDWYLLKLDNFNEPALIKRLREKGPYISIQLPEASHRYQLVAYLVKDGYTLGTRSSLSTPLYFGTELHKPTREELEYQRKKSL